MFGLNEREIQNGYDSAMQAPYNPEVDNSASFFDGAGSAVLSGVKDASAKILQRVASPPKEGEELSPMGLPRLLLSRAIQPDAIRDVIKQNRPDPSTTGWLGQQVFSLSSMLLRAGAGTLATGSPVGGAVVVGETERFSTKQDLISEGVDENTAGSVATVAGVTTGLGALLPAAVPGKLLTRLASGAAINVGAGGVYRGSTRQLLDEGGYKDMAEQYRIFDAAAITTDAILGSAFGAISRGSVRPSDVDGALAANSLHQLEVEAAPGLPTDAASRNAHIAAMDKGLEQLALGEKVNVDVEGSFMPVAKVDSGARDFIEGIYNPAADSSSGESFTPFDITSVGDSPLTQDLPVQRSEPTPPSTFAKRAITLPSNLTGDVSNLSISKSYHTVRDLQQIRQLASELLSPLKKELRATTKGIDGAEYYDARIKEEASLQTKLARKGSPEAVSDYLGGRIVADTPEAIDRVVARLRERNEIMEVDDFLGGNRAGGYRAIHVQMMSDKGISVEVQIQPKEIREAQDKAHGNYKKWQEIEKENGGIIPDELFAAKLADDAADRKTFDDAWTEWEKRTTGKDVLPVEAQDIIASYKDPDAFADDALRGKNKLLEVQTPEQAARQKQIDAAEAKADKAQKALSELTRDIKDGQKMTKAQRAALTARDDAMNELRDLRATDSGSLSQKLGLTLNRDKNKAALVSLFNKSRPKEKSPEAKVLERNPDMKIVDDNGEVVTAKEALDRAKAEARQVEEESKLFDVAVSCFLEVGDA